MTATWTTPRTWVANEIGTATIFNTHVRNMFDYLGSLEDGDGNPLSALGAGAVVFSGLAIATAIGFSQGLSTNATTTYNGKTSVTITPSFAADHILVYANFFASYSNSSHLSRYRVEKHSGTGTGSFDISGTDLSQEAQLGNIGNTASGASAIMGLYNATGSTGDDYGFQLQFSTNNVGNTAGIANAFLALLAFKGSE